MFGPVVECSDQWSGARTYGLVLGLVVGCSEVVWCSEVVRCSGRGCAMAAALRARHACSATASGEPGEAYSVQGLGGGHGQCECAVLVCLEAGDGLGLCAHGMERHGRSSKVQWRAGNEPGLTVGVVEERMAVQCRVAAV